MKINYVETRKRFDDAHINQSAAARAIGVSIALFNQIVNGTYHHSLGGKDAKKVLAYLESRGILVLEEDHQEPEAPQAA